MASDGSGSTSLATGGHVAVLVPAAGMGARMGGAPKQFRLLGGAPVLVQTLRVFARHPLVRELVVAVPADARTEVEALLSAHGLDARVVVGGASRQSSVARALDALRDEVGIVLVHDAVRPFVTAEAITAVIETAKADGAAALAVPVPDTLRRGDERRPSAFFSTTVPRDGLFAMQTPQAARADWLRAALAAAERDGFEGTDEVELLQRAGYAVCLVEGDTRNFKLTRAADWALAEALWPAWVRGDE